MEKIGDECILIVDDETAILELMQETLELQGYRVTPQSNPLLVPEMIRESEFDLVISDINMPHLDGLQLLKIVKEADLSLPVIIITGSSDMDNLMTSFRLGAFDYLKKPFSMNELIITVTQALQKRQLQKQVDDYHKNLEFKVQEKTRALSDANQKLEQNLLKATLAMVNALDASDRYTKGHSERVAMISLMLARELGLDYITCKNLRLGAVLHDIGKIGINHDILHKPLRLTHEEYEVMKSHPAIGVNITRPIDLDPIVFQIVGQHHERMDGSGYPNGLKGDQITLPARIVAVADAFDAITSDRPYRNRFSADYAVREILSNIHTQFDENVAYALRSIHKDIDTGGEPMGFTLLKLPGDS